MTESPTGDYANNLNISATLTPINLSGATGASLSFMTKYALESGYDYMYLEISTNGTSWTQLDQFNGMQNSWTPKTYSLNDYLGKPYVLVRFRMVSDIYVTEDGMYIDDLEIDVWGVGVDDISGDRSLFKIYPNPFNNYTVISFDLDEAKLISIDILDIKGQKITELTDKEYLSGSYQLTWNGENEAGYRVDSGVYFIRILIDDKTESVKVIRKP
jgi:hypothetical protein